MSSKFAELLLKDATLRTEEDYTGVIDDFFSGVGGRPLAELVMVPPCTYNADYLVEWEDCSLIVELKQIRANDFTKTFMSQLFRFMAEKGGISVEIEGTNRCIKGKGDGRGRWLTFWDHVRPGIMKALEKANQQLCDSKALIKRKLPTICGVILLNTGDESLPVDVLSRIVEYKVGGMWRTTHFRSIDFVIAGTIDMVWDESHPQQGFLLARPTEDVLMKRAIERFWIGWQQYLISEIGERAHREFSEGDSKGTHDLCADYKGKLQRRA